MKNYQIRSAPSSNSERAPVLAELMLPGKPGADLLLTGTTEKPFALFVAKMAHACVAKGLTVEQTGDILQKISGVNASGAGNLIKDFEVLFLDEEGEPSLTENPLTEDGKARWQSVSSYWQATGKKAAPTGSLVSKLGL